MIADTILFIPSPSYLQPQFFLAFLKALFETTYSNHRTLIKTSICAA
jgi:hypothetical protein